MSDCCQPTEQTDHCAPKKPWYKDKLFIFAMATLVVVFASPWIAPIRQLHVAYLDYFKKMWWAISLGLVLGGLIDQFVPQDKIRFFLAREKKRTIVYAVALGLFMSACCHGVLAISMELYKKGASIPGVVAFLLASPWTNLPLTFLMFSFFGWKAIFIVFGALIVAVNTGLMFQVLQSAGFIETNKEPESLPEINEKKSVSLHLKNVLKSMGSLARMVLWWSVLGMFFASLIRVLVPHHFFMNFLGNSLLGLFSTLGFATVIEVCSEGSVPIAFEIFNQTGALGNVFVFLMAGVATDYTEIGLIWANIGKKTALWLPLITVPQILVLGYLYNVFV